MNTRLPPALRAGAGIAALAFLSACGDNSSNATTAANGGTMLATSVAAFNPTPYSAEIRRTAHGIAHIKADDEGGIGYGVAYAYAQDNFCLLADEIVTVNGERSKYFGAEGTGNNPELSNLQTDYFYKLINEAGAVSNAWYKQPGNIRTLLEGYVAGYNRYLSQTGKAGLPAACQGADWVRPITTADMMKLIRRYAAEGGAGQFVAAIVGAAPPGATAAVAAPVPAKVNPMTPQYWKQLRAKVGSNGVALGKDGSANGQGLLLTNPHFPWQSTLRFYQVHLTIPGKLDAMGVSLGGLPVVNIGFNQDVAWGHTVNTSAHFTSHLLLLDPANPTRYVVDGRVQPMSKRSVSVEVKGADGVVATQTRDFYSSRFGMLAVMPGMLDWNSQMAFTILDANLDNHRMLEQWSAMNRARTLDEFKASIDRIVGLPWVNTIAADKAGNALYMDVTVVPHVSKLKQTLCVPLPFQPLAAQGLFVLNGALSACAWGSDRNAPQEGIFAGASLPRLVRSDYVQNSNDSAWMSNPAAPLVGFPDIVSIAGNELAGRTRIGISQIRARLAGTDGMGGKGMSMSQLQTLVLNNRVYYADQIMDDLMTLCAGGKNAVAEDGSAVDLTTPCAKLAVWDRTANLDANIGYAYFGKLLDRIRTMPGVWAVPFNPFNPVNTPRGLNLLNPLVKSGIRTAFATAVQEVHADGWTLDSTWGQLQGVFRGETRIPIHGGTDEWGVYNAIMSVPIGGGLREVVFGTSYLQTVGFDKTGPQAQAVLSYSQSTNPESPYFADQTELFSRKAWVTLPYTEAQIQADPNFKSTVLSGN